MTETDTTSTTSTTETSPEAVYSGPDTMAGEFLTVLAGLIQRYTVEAGRLAAVEGDRENAIAVFMENSDDPKAIKLRAAIEKYQTQLQELAESSVASENMSEDDKAKLKTELEVLAKRIRSGRETVKGIATTTEADVPGVMAVLEKLGDPTRSGRGRKPGSAGSSLPRTSATITITDADTETGKNMVGHVFDKFSEFALKFNCDVVDIQKEFAKAAGVAHSDIKTIDHEVVFDFQPNSNGTVWTLKTEPKTRAPRGSKTGPKSETDTAE